MESKKISILGGGSWGTALGILLAKKDSNNYISIWMRDKKQIKDIRLYKENRKYLPGVRIPNNICVEENIKNSIKDSEIILLSIPSHSIRKVLESIKDYIKEDQIIVNVAKGIENNTLERVSEIVNTILPNNDYVVLSGPSHAEEVALDIPTTVVSSSKNIKVAEKIQDIFMTPKFRVYTNLDVVGVELGGALKNIIALAAGISDGLGYGDNTKAALMTRGIFEIAKLGIALGAKESTFFGLAGVGDLIVTCTSVHSRNRKAGLLIGEGNSIDKSIKEVGMVVEGIKTTKSAYLLAKKHNINMPITEELYKVLYEGANVKSSVDKLMSRSKKYEMEELINN